MTKGIRTTALILASCFALPVSAATLDVNGQHPSIFGDVNNQNRWYEITAMSVGTTSVKRVAAGAFRLTAGAANSPFASFLAFCLEPLEALQMPRTYSMESKFSPGITADLQALAANGMSLVTDRSSAAAFQMAAWEITTETGIYDIDDGFFKITGTSGRSNAAEALAQSWLNNIQANQWTPSNKPFSILRSDGVQDLVTNVQLASMPLPAGGLLLLGGLAGLGGMSARRRKA